MISILLLCWNHSKYLEQCISSLASQTVAPDQIVFLDNCSSDGSLELATALFEKYGLKALILANDSPQGISRNFNRLAAEATSPLIAPLSTDDWYAPDYVREMRAAAEAFPHADWFYPAASFFFQESGEFRSIPTENFHSGDVRQWVRKLEWPFGFVGCCYRRNVILELGGWDETLPVEDNDMMFRLGLSKTCQFVDSRLVYYRRFMGSVTTNLLFCATAWDGFFRKHHDQIEQPDAAHGEMMRAFAAMALDRGEVSEAATLLAKAARLTPWRTENLRTLWYLVRTGAKRAVRR